MVVFYVYCVLSNPQSPRTARHGFAGTHFFIFFKHVKLPGHFVGLAQAWSMPLFEKRETQMSGRLALKEACQKQILC